MNLLAIILFGIDKKCFFRRRKQSLFSNLSKISQFPIDFLGMDRIKDGHREEGEGEEEGEEEEEGTEISRKG